MKSTSKGFKWATKTIIWPEYYQTTDVRKLRKKLGICINCFVNRVPDVVLFTNWNQFSKQFLCQIDVQWQGDEMTCKIFHLWKEDICLFAFYRQILSIRSEIQNVRKTIFNGYNNSIIIPQFYLRTKNWNQFWCI